jgi:hypothetical protein
MSITEIHRPFGGDLLYFVKNHFPDRLNTSCFRQFADYRILFEEMFLLGLTQPKRTFDPFVEPSARLASLTV